MSSSEKTPHELGEGELSVTQLPVAHGARSAIPQAERELLVAILEDAIRSYQKYAFSGTRRGQRLFREVHAWFTEPPTADVAVSFDYVCEMLDMAADPIRQALERWRGHAFAGQGSAVRRVGTKVEVGGGIPLAPVGSTGWARSPQRVVPPGWKVVGDRR
jgi:hypothetical protein